MKRKENRKFYLSVEGETEKWYFEHLKTLINKSEYGGYKISYNLEIEKNPVSFVKSVNILSDKAFHIFDYESNNKEHVAVFNNTLQKIKEAEKLRSEIKYKIGYSNQSFDLWIIMHKKKLTCLITENSDYLEHINKAYNTNFKNFDKYKQEDNFKKQILSEISLKDVFFAIESAKGIRENNEKNSKKSEKFNGFKYYPDNPDLTVHECVKEMLSECEFKDEQ
ncbi:MAG: RloB family protein [Endomicrobium sp.]|jgi:hypothetical protein|nr:RloB family protein [Endomicrobium sp.]